MASETRVIINLSDQRASLVEQGKITLVSPIASGKPGWQTPTGNFCIFNKDINHLSRSFGSVVDAYGRVVSSSATPSTYLPRGGHHRIQPGSWDARPLPSWISRVPRMRADASRSRCSVFPAGPNRNTSHGCRHHAQPDSGPKGHSDTAQRFICVGSALIGSSDHPGVGRGHWTKVQ